MNNNIPVNYYLNMFKENPHKYFVVRHGKVLTGLDFYLDPNGYYIHGCHKCFCVSALCEDHNNTGLIPR